MTLERKLFYPVIIIWALCLVLAAVIIVRGQERPMTQRAGDSDAPARVLFLAGNWDKMSERTAFVLDVNEPGIYRVEVQRFGTGKLTVKVTDVATQRVVSTGKLERER